MTSSLVYHQRSLRSCDRGFRQLRYLLRNSTPCTYEEVIACREYHNCVVDETSQRTVHVALTGAPNAGKSTLLNALVGRKISAVSQKTNTTYRNTVGYFEHEDTQAVIFDTPGVVEQRQYLDQKHGERVESAWNVVGSSDVALLIVDAYRQISRPDPRIVRLIQGFKQNILANSTGAMPKTGLVLTKIDRVLADEMNFQFEEMSEHFYTLSQTDRVFHVSGLRGIGLKELKEYIISSAKTSPWTIDKDNYHRAHTSAIIHEIIREKIFRAYYKEIPYAIHIKVSSVTDAAKDILIKAKLEVQSSSMKMIVIGKNGSAISSVERAAQHELSNIFNKRVHLNLSVLCLDQ